jgi:hypothetical protein
MTATPGGARERKLAPVRPADFGTPAWEEWVEPLVELAKKKFPEASTDEQRMWADRFLLEASDEGDLRALGYCRHCGGRVTLRQVGHCVYTEPCGHYRAQGELRRMQPYLNQRRNTISAERRAALLALISEALHDA